MFVVSVPYGIFNKTCQATIYFKKKKENTHTKDYSFEQISPISLSHRSREKNNN